MDEYRHFPHTVLELIQYDGMGTKIASIVLHFAYGQNDANPVDSHVIKCAIALKWIPDFCKSLEAVEWHFSNGNLFIFGHMPHGIGIVWTTIFEIGMAKTI